MSGNVAFSAPALGTFGSAGVGTVRAPGYFNWDLGVGKKFNVTESHYIDFRAEFFNFTNTPSFSPPTTRLDRDVADVRPGRRDRQPAANHRVRAEVPLLVRTEVLRFTRKKLCGRAIKPVRPAFRLSSPDYVTGDGPSRPVANSDSPG